MVSREKVSPAPGKQRFPMEIRCYGRRYVVETVSEALACMEALIEKRLMDANRYRVGKSWPRGQRRPRKWICGDCWLSHMWWTERCPVSLRSGRTRSYSVRGDRHMATVRSHNKVVRVKPRAMTPMRKPPEPTTMQITNCKLQDAFGGGCHPMTRPNGQSGRRWRVWTACAAASDRNTRRPTEVSRASNGTVCGESW